MFNTGTITGLAIDGVSINSSGSVTNAASASIIGDHFGVAISGDLSELLNSGTISATNATLGVGALLGGGSLTNTASGAIVGGKDGVEVGDFVSLANFGAVSGSNIGVALSAGGEITNATSASITGGKYGINVTGGEYTALKNDAGGSIEGSVGIRLAAGGTVENAGTITGLGGKALVLYGRAPSRVVVDAGAVFNGAVVGSASANNTLELASSASTGTISGLGTNFINFRSMVVDPGAQWELTGSSSLASGSTLTNIGTLSLSGATLSAAGGVVNFGHIELDPSTMSVASLTGTGTVAIDDGSILAVQGAVSSGQDIVFSGSGGELDLATPLAFSGTITGFAEGDVIDLTSVADVDGSSADMDYANNLLTVTEGSTSYQFQFDKGEIFAGDFFHLVSQNGRTIIAEDQIACYRRGALIATGQGEAPVETLAIGDEIMTLSGVLRRVKWIGRRSYRGRFILGRKDILPICFKAGSIENGIPRRDLWISPHHAMLLDGVLIEARDLINGVSIVQAEHVEEVEYFHIELDSHDAILAEGAWSETFVDDDSRGMFHNAHEHALLYPETVPEPARYCAPRVAAGFELEAIRQHLARRAGLVPPAAQADRLRGHIDRISVGLIEGWAQNADHPEAPVCLDICADGRLIGRTLANHYRADLKQAGLGSGRHAFVFRLPSGALPLSDAIEVRRSFDGTPVGTVRPRGWRPPLNLTGS